MKESIGSKSLPYGSFSEGNINALFYHKLAKEEGSGCKLT